VTYSIEIELLFDEKGFSLHCIYIFPKMPSLRRGGRNASVKIESLVTNDGKKILRNMKLDFPSNSVTAIMGPSGSGKSTLLNYVSGNMTSGITVTGKGEIMFK